MCSREIAHYERLNNSLPEPKIEFFNLVQEQHHPGLEHRGISKETALRRMHVLTAEGDIVRNAEAFVQIWTRMPYWNWIVPFTKLPVRC